jgi:hypothetical protein
VAAAVDAVAMRQRTTNNDAMDRCCLAGAVSDIIHRGASTGEPRFDAGRLTMQHLSNCSYCTITNLMLHKGRRHAVRVRRGRGRRTQIGRNNQIEDNVDGGSSLAL